MFSLIHLLLFILDQLFQVSVSIHGPFSRIQPHIKDSYTNINTVIFWPKEHCYSNNCFHVGCLAKFFGKSLLIQDGFWTFWTPGLKNGRFLDTWGYTIHIDMDDMGPVMYLGAVFFGGILRSLP